LYTTFTQKGESEEDVMLSRAKRRSSVGVSSGEFTNIANWEEAALMRQLALSQEDWGTILQEGAELLTFSKDDVRNFIQ
jgi:hypothetical protein